MLSISPPSYIGCHNFREVFVTLIDWIHLSRNPLANRRTQFEFVIPSDGDHERIRLVGTVKGVSSHLPNEVLIHVSFEEASDVALGGGRSLGDWSIISVTDKEMVIAATIKRDGVPLRPVSLPLLLLSVGSRRQPH